MKVETFKIDNWEKNQTGLVVAEDKNWVLVRHIPSDYVVDGYKLYQKKHIKKRINGESEQKVAKVLKLRKVKAKAPKGFKFKKMPKMLKWVEEKYGFFEFQDDIQTELFYGTIRKIKKNKLQIDFINSDGQVEKNFTFPFNLKKIRNISFDTDYFRAIDLLMKN